MTIEDKTESNCGIRKKINRLELLKDLLIPGSFVKLTNRAIKENSYNTREKICMWASTVFGEGIRIGGYEMLAHNLYEIYSRF